MDTEIMNWTEGLWWSSEEGYNKMKKHYKYCQLLKI